MIDNEELIREFLSSLPDSDIKDSVHLADLNFERCPFEDIIKAIYSLYLEVAKNTRYITNYTYYNQESSIDDEEYKRLVADNTVKSKVLNKLLDYTPIRKELTNSLNNQEVVHSRQT